MQDTGLTFWDSFSEQLLKITMAKRIGFRLIYIPFKDSKYPNSRIWQLVMVPRCGNGEEKCNLFCYQIILEIGSFI
jgi:hypothetical protein